MNFHRVTLHEKRLFRCFSLHPIVYMTHFSFSPSISIIAIHITKHTHLNSLIINHQNPVFPTILKPVDQMIYGFCFLSCSLVVVRKIDGVEAGHAWKDEKHPYCGGAAEPAAS